MRREAFLLRPAVPALLALLALAAGCSGGGGGAMESRFQAGNAAYERGAFEEAAGIYREVAAAGVESAALHYNLGNALFKGGHLGRAILEYERALKIDPGDEDSRENLEYLRTLTVDEIVPAASPLNALGIAYLMGLTTPGQDALLLVLAWLASGIALGVGIAARGENVRRSAYYAAGALLVPALLFGASLGGKLWIASSGEHAIVLAGEVEVLSGAGEDNPALFTVHEGLKVRVRSRSGRWAQVSLANGMTGWLPQDSFEAL